MSHAWLTSSVIGILFVAAACGGSAPKEPAGAPAGSTAAPTLETRWLRGLWANDIRDQLATVGLTCKGPLQEKGTNEWTCESGTPLVSYQVRFYGRSPGKIEYIHAVVTQSGSAKDALALRVFGVLAGLHFDGADLAQARLWLQATMATGGDLVIGPARYKLAGDTTHRTFDVKASGSDW